MNTFEKELAFYKANKAKLVELFHGKWLVIKEDALLGVAKNLYDAYDQIHMLHLFYVEPPIMMHQCLYNEPVMGIPGGLTWQDNEGNSVPPDPRDLIAFEEGSRIKFPLDYQIKHKFTENQFNALSNIWNNLKEEK